MKYDNTITDLCRITGVSKRTMQYKMQQNAKQIQPFRTRIGRSFFYDIAVLTVLGFKNSTEFNDPIKNENTTTDQTEEIRKLKQAIEMLNYQISNNFETINELKKDKERLYNTIDQLTETIKGSLMNTHRAQELNYLDKPKEEN